MRFNGLGEAHLPYHPLKKVSEGSGCQCVELQIRRWGRKDGKRREQVRLTLLSVFIHTVYEYYLLNQSLLPSFPAIISPPDTARSRLSSSPSDTIQLSNQWRSPHHNADFPCHPPLQFASNQITSLLRLAMNRASPMHSV
eukprot:TRINITY_DN750_c0_g1_i10.p1 TRINITY_DN750_c0_g1~~TRINITY_DN750_c0_g1_i10.p1  ORF type:complete len:140 (-),score=7.84 TRINITY_DN750_c0_g1_i10:168-587(-)